MLHFKGNLDVAFDAGGKVSMGLLVTNLVSMWTWAATLLQSSAVGSKVEMYLRNIYSSGYCIMLLYNSTASVVRFGMQPEPVCKYCCSLL